MNERISFLREQINPSNRPIVNETFQSQIDLLRNPNREQIANLILLKKRQLEECRSIHESDRIFTELEALEWLQRQVVKRA
ncbi:MAG: hypothetical protein ACREBU_03755 [Nitrososphaera sp.]